MDHLKLTDIKLTVRMPDGETKELDLTNDADARCFAKAKVRQAPTFTVVGYDLTALSTIKHWRDVNPQTYGTSKDVHTQNRMCAFEDYSRENPTRMKLAD